jgi:hypothetical protein
VSSFVSLYVLFFYFVFLLIFDFPPIFKCTCCLRKSSNSGFSFMDGIVKKYRGDILGCADGGTLYLRDPGILAVDAQMNLRTRVSRLLSEFETSRRSGTVIEDVTDIAISPPPLVDGPLVAAGTPLQPCSEVGREDLAGPSRSGERKEQKGCPSVRYRYHCPSCLKLLSEATSVRSHYRSKHKSTLQDMDSSAPNFWISKQYRCISKDGAKCFYCTDSVQDSEARQEKK